MPGRLSSGGLTGPLRARVNRGSVLPSAFASQKSVLSVCIHPTHLLRSLLSVPVAQGNNRVRTRRVTKPAQSGSLDLELGWVPVVYESQLTNTRSPWVHGMLYPSP